MFAAFRDPDLEPTVRALDAIGVTIADEPVESELIDSSDNTAHTDANTSENAPTVNRVAGVESKPRYAHKRTSFTLHQLLEPLLQFRLFETEESLPPAVDYHEQARNVFQTTDCSSSIAGVRVHQGQARVARRHRLPDGRPRLGDVLGTGRSSVVSGDDPVWKDNPRSPERCAECRHRTRRR